MHPIILVPRRLQNRIREKHVSDGCFSFPAFALLLQVFQPRTLSVPAEAGLGGVGGGLKDQEAGPSLGGKDAGASQQRAARQPWQERWLVRQLHLQQRMLPTVTVFLKVSEYCTRFHTHGWATSVLHSYVSVIYTLPHFFRHL